MPRSEHFCGPSSAHQVFSGVSLVCKKFQKICQNQSLVPVRYLYIIGENMEWGHQKVVKMSQILFYVMTFGNVDNVSTKIQRVIWFLKTFWEINFHLKNFIGKIQKTFFSGEVIFGGQNQKMQKKISKNFIVPNRSLGHTDHLYTYKGHIEHVGFT